MTPSPEMMQLLVWSVVLLLVHIAVQATLALIECGPVWGAGSRGEGGPAPDGAAGRASRALGNFLQTYPAFVALALALMVSGRGMAAGLVGAQIWLVARAAYLPIYVLGVPWVRTAAFLASVAGLIVMLAALR